jgi:hypothetical protein
MNPTVEIARADPIGKSQERVVRRDQVHRSILIAYARDGTGHTDIRKGDESRGAVFTWFLILHNERPTRARILPEPLSIGGNERSGFKRADSNDNGIVRIQIGER